MIRAILFDFNGVILDDEPVHLELFQKVLGDEGIDLSRDDYYSKFLGMDDHDCFQAAAKNKGKSLSEEQVEQLTAKKSKLYFNKIKKNPPFIPGVLKFIRDFSKTHFLAIVSGALRQEIEWALEIGKVKDDFSVIVGAEEVKKGKPDPEGFQKALNTLNRDFVAASERLLPEECVVIEDSHWGIEAGRKSGMVCVGVTTSYRESELSGAKFCVKDFEECDSQEFLSRVKNLL